MVCRAVAIPQQVSSLALVSVAGGPSVPAHLHPALRYFHGRFIIAPGQNGIILLYSHFAYGGTVAKQSYHKCCGSDPRGKSTDYKKLKIPIYLSSSSCFTSVRWKPFCFIGFISICLKNTENDF